MGDSKTKPTLDEVIAYGQPLIRMFISDAATDVPKEQREEIEQEAYLRLINAYKELDPEKGWKSFVYNHCRGAVLDYMKFGRGFHENRWSIQKEEKVGSRNVSKMHERVNLVSHDGEEVDIDQIIGQNGVFSALEFEKMQIKWDLVSRMASQDIILHVFAKWIWGIGIEEMAPVFGLSRARIGQLIQAFVDRFDDPEEADSAWFKQICYAFDLCNTLGMPNIDQSVEMGFSVGWHLQPVDLNDLTPCQEIRESKAQMSFFTEEDNE